MKKNKLKLITKLLAIIAICLISFVGIYVQKGNKMDNIIKGYTLNKDLSGYRQITLNVSDAVKVLDSEGKEVGNTDTVDEKTIESNKYTKSEEKVNSDESRTSENYAIGKEIIEKRLKELGVKDYNISMDKQTGKMYIQFPEFDESDRIVSNIKEKGNIQLKDSEDGTVYIDSNNLKKAKVLYNTTESGTAVYLSIQFDEEGTEKLKELSSNQYATLKTEDNEETEKNEEETKNDDKEEAKEEDTKKDEAEENKEEEKQKEVTLVISGNDVVTTSFDEPIETGSIELSMNKATKDNKEANEYLQSASIIVALLNNGALPVEYTIEGNQYVTTDISNEMINKAIFVISIVLAFVLLYIIIKNKEKGLAMVASFAGFLAIYLLVLRYTNIEIGLESIVAIILTLGVDLAFNMKLLKINKEEEKKYNKQYLQFIEKVIPAFAISIIFCFTKWSVLINFGMTMFWGIILIIIYNRLVTKKIVD